MTQQPVGRAGPAGQERVPVGPPRRATSVLVDGPSAHTFGRATGPLWPSVSSSGKWISRLSRPPRDLRVPSLGPPPSPCLRVTPLARCPPPPGPGLTQQQQLQLPAVPLLLFQEDPVDLLVDPGRRLLLLRQAPGAAAPGQRAGHGRGSEGARGHGPGPPGEGAPTRPAPGTPSGTPDFSASGTRRAQLGEA